MNFISANRLNPRAYTGCGCSRDAMMSTAVGRLHIHTGSIAHLLVRSRLQVTMEVLLRTHAGEQLACRAPARRKGDKAAGIVDRDG